MIKYLKYLLVFLLSLNNASTFAQLQGQAKIDTLLKELALQKEDTNKVNLLHDLSNEYVYINPDEGLKYARQCSLLAAKLNWRIGIAKANRSLGASYFVRSDNAKALKYFEVALRLYEELNYKNGVAVVTGNIGNIYAQGSDYEKALEYYFKALKMNEELKFKTGIATITGNIGAIRADQGDYPKALEYYFKAKKIYEDLGIKEGIARVTENIGKIYRYKSNYPKAREYNNKALKVYEGLGSKSGMASVTGNIGSIYLSEGDHPNALKYYFNALKIYEEMGDKGGMARITGNIGVIYKKVGDYPKALDYYLKSMKIFEEIGDKRLVATTMGNIGNLYSNEKNYPKALEYLSSAMKTHEQIGDKKGMANTICNIGNIYNYQHNYTQAVAWHSNGLQIAREIGDKSIEALYLDCLGWVYISIVINPPGSAKISNVSELPGTAPYRPDGMIPIGRSALLHKALTSFNMAIAINKEIGSLDNLQNAYLNLSVADSLLGDYKGALEARDNYHAIRDSLFSQENKEEILKMGMKNEYDRQRLTDSLKVAERQKITTINLKKQKSYTYMGVAGILLLAGFSFFIVKERGKSEKARKQSDDLLLNILPEEVASELKATGTTTAKHFDHVTVLFTDFVNFTQASESMGAQNLIDELHTCFKKFDEITAKYNIEKIKTIGDAYLAVAGLPTADQHHAVNVVNAAKEITAFMEDRLAKLGAERTFQIRVGVHSGSVVAGIVGVKKFAYDIWGDTVNTAARMEQNSEAGKINISQTTYELVKGKFTCEYRGEVDVKGKGVMKMYYVV